MAKKKEVDQQIKELKSKIDENKVLFGKNSVLRAIKAKKVVKVLLSSNCPADVVADINHYAKLADVEVVPVNYTNEELGVLCKKNFFVSILGFSA